MDDLAISALDGDIAVVGGDLALATDTAAIMQALRIRLRLGLGEWFLDTRLGVPYYEQVLVKRPDLAAIEVLMRQTILDTPGVTRIVQYAQALASEPRRLSITFEVQTADEETLDLVVALP